MLAKNVMRNICISSASFTATKVNALKANYTEVLNFIKSCKNSCVREEKFMKHL
jgi:hypothetical protein